MPIGESLLELSKRIPVAEFSFITGITWRKIAVGEILDCFVAKRSAVQGVVRVADDEIPCVCQDLLAIPVLEVDAADVMVDAPHSPEVQDQEVDGAPAIRGETGSRVANVLAAELTNRRQQRKPVQLGIVVMFL